MHDEKMREIAEEDAKRISGGGAFGNIDGESARTGAFAWGTCPPCPNCGSKNTHPYVGFAGLPYACGDCETAFG